MPRWLRELSRCAPWEVRRRALVSVGIFASVLVLRTSGALAQSPPEDVQGAAPTVAPASAGLPPAVAAGLHAAGVRAGAVAVVVQPLSGSGIALALNDRVPMNPASTMKLVTTYVALNLLGTAYTWPTGVFADRPNDH